MNDAVAQPKFGWRARSARAVGVFGLGLVSTFLVEFEGFAVAALGFGAHGDSGLFGSLEELLLFPLTEPFWFVYAIFGLPVAVAHALGSLAWQPGIKTVPAHTTLTLVACVAMGSAVVANPFFSYVFAVVLLVLGHFVCISGPLPPARRSESAPTA